MIYLIILRYTKKLKKIVYSITNRKHFRSLVLIILVVVGILGGSQSAFALNKGSGDEIFRFLMMRRPMQAARDYTWSFFDLLTSTFFGKALEKTTVSLARNNQFALANSTAKIASLSNGYSSYCREGLNTDFPLVGGLLHHLQMCTIKVISPCNSPEMSIQMYRALCCLLNLAAQTSQNPALVQLTKNLNKVNLLTLPSNTTTMSLNRMSRETGLPLLGFTPGSEATYNPGTQDWLNLSKLAKTEGCKMMLGLTTGTTVDILMRLSCASPQDCKNIISQFIQKGVNSPDPLETLKLISKNSLPND